MKHKRSEATRARIIAASRQLFLENGFDATSVAEICRVSGVSNGALFHQFPVKEDIAFAVYTEVRAEFWDQVISAMTAADEPLDGIEAAVRAALEFQQAEPGGAAFMFDVSGSKWIERYAHKAQPLHDAVTARGLEWSVPHIAAGRLPQVLPDVFIALASGAPQWIARMNRIGMTGANFDLIAAELPRYVRRAFTP